MKRNKSFPVTLACKHVTILPYLPESNAILPCFQCRNGQTISLVHVYTADCLNCTYRNHEGDLNIVSTRARAHCEGRGHEVKITYPSHSLSVVLVPQFMLGLGATA